jgi:hypothetical protein
MNILSKNKEIEQKVRDIFKDIELSEILELAKYEENNYGVIHQTIIRTFGRIAKEITNEAKDYKISKCANHDFYEWKWSLRKNILGYHYHYKRTCKHCPQQQMFNVDEQKDAPKGIENEEK